VNGNDVLVYFTKYLVTECLQYLLIQVCFSRCRRYNWKWQ